jgi:hypothetical protein
VSCVTNYLMIIIFSRCYFRFKYLLKLEIPFFCKFLSSSISFPFLHGSRRHRHNTGRKCTIHFSFAIPSRSQTFLTLFLLSVNASLAYSVAFHLFRKRYLLKLPPTNAEPVGVIGVLFSTMRISSACD